MVTKINLFHWWNGIVSKISRRVEIKKLRYRHFVGMVDFYEDEDEEENPRLCRRCRDFGVVSKLGPRIVKQNEEPGPDWDQFMQCATCGTIYRLYEVKSEQIVSGFTHNR